MRVSLESAAAGPGDDLIDEACEFLRGRVRRTPLEDSPALAEVLGVPVRLKLEHLQETGSFKLRGALFRMSRLDAGERRAGVAACSAGNHGMAVARAARDLGVAATVYVPSTVDGSKRRGIAELGARVVESPFPGYDDTQSWALERVAASGAAWISAFDDPAVMAANGGSLAAEVLEDDPEAGVFVMPVGGGGLAAGFARQLERRRPGARLVACQHTGSPGLARSLERGEAVTRLPAIETAAGGVEGGIGAACFEVLRDRVHRVALVDEDQILAAVAWTLDRHRYLIEPSAAVAVAACLEGAVGALDAPAVVVLTGRNVAVATLADILGR